NRPDTKRAGSPRGAGPPELVRPGARRHGSEVRTPLRVLLGELHLRSVARNLDRQVPVQLVVQKGVARVHPPLPGWSVECGHARRVGRVGELLPTRLLQPLVNCYLEVAEGFV